QTMNIQQLIAEIEVELEASKTAAQRILDNVKAENRSNMTADEDAELTRLAAKRDSARRKLAEARKIQAEEEATDAAMREVRPMADAKRAGVSYDSVVRITAEPHVYREQVERNWDGTPKDPTYLQDLYRAQVQQDPAAIERLGRHGQEIERDRPEI